MISLETELCGLRLKSPLVLASGIMGLSASSLFRAVEAGAGCVTTKSCGIEERDGHRCPVIFPFEHGLINAVGLANPGVDEMCREIENFRKRAKVPVIASLFGKTIEEFGVAAEKILPASPDMIEVNVSCPNVASEFGQSFAADIKACGAITRVVKSKANKTPISIKLSLQCPSLALAARICEDNGADAVTAINSVGPGMLIDVNVGKPVLSNLVGGISGGCILPLAVKAVWEISQAVKIPVIGTGGVTKTEDAVQLFMAGATAVGIGTGIYSGGLKIFSEINAGLAEFLAEKGFNSLSQIRGLAHG